VSNPELLGTRGGARTVAADERDHLESGDPQRRHVHAPTESGADHDRLQPVSPFPDDCKERSAAVRW